MYWGVPPWLKHKLPPPEHSFPWPMSSVNLPVWICGYFSQEISKGLAAPACIMHHVLKWSYYIAFRTYTMT
jgi:hypothetical protein